MHRIFRATALSLIASMTVCNSELLAQEDTTALAKLHPGPQVVHLPSHERLRIYTKKDKTFARLTNEITKKNETIALSRDKYTDPNGSFEDFSYIGQTRSRAVIIAETYHTNANPNGYCGAGTEKTLQVLTTKPKLRETFVIKLTSCIDNFELAEDDGAVLNQKTNVLTIHWWYRDGCDEKRIYKIAEDGTVKQISRVAKKHKH